MNKSQRALFAGGFAAVGLILTTIALLETAFFHLNPIKIGYRRFDFGRYVILSKSSVPNSDYESISESMYRNEDAMALRFKTTVQIILCEKQSDIDRYQPFASAADKRNATAFAPWPNTIYVTPKAEEEFGTIQATVGHELSHVLLIQNFGLIKATILWKRAEWIPEGFATYLNNWPNYFPRSQLLPQMKQAGIDPNSNSFPSPAQLAKLPLPLRFMIYRYFVEYLYRRMPPASIVEFLREASNSPWNTIACFTRAFGDSIDSYWNAFGMTLVEK